MDYRTAGVDVAAGDRASQRALEHARRTFGFRAGRPGAAVALDGVFTGLIDVGPFYLALNSDGVGSKALVAQATGNYRTLGFDLVAMVADDAACAGAEPVALVNTLDVQRVAEVDVDALMSGLELACQRASVSVVGGEIAELGDQVRDFSWSAALVGMLPKDRVLGPQRVRSGDALVGILTDNFRANGFTLLRRILQDALGEDWHAVPFDALRTWGDVALEPSDQFSPFMTRLTGGFAGEPRAAVSACAHVTGGGLEGNVGRVIPAGLQVRWDALPPPPAAMREAMRLGAVAEAEARRAWNMGVGMVIATPEPERVTEEAADAGWRTAELGRVVAG